MPARCMGDEWGKGEGEGGSISQRPIMGAEKEGGIYDEEDARKKKNVGNRARQTTIVVLVRYSTPTRIHHH